MLTQFCFRGVSGELLNILHLVPHSARHTTLLSHLCVTSSPACLLCPCEWQITLHKQERHCPDELSFFFIYFFFLQFLGKKHLALGTLCGQLRWQRLEFPFSFVMRSSVSWLLGLPCSPMCCFFMTNLLVQSFCIRASKKAPWDCDLQGVALVCCREGL